MSTTCHLILDNGQHIFLPYGTLIRVRNGLVGQLIADEQNSIYVTNNMGTRRIYSDTSYDLLTEPFKAEVNIHLEAMYRAWCQEKNKEKEG